MSGYKHLKKISSVITLYGERLTTYGDISKKFFLVGYTLTVFKDGYVSLKSPDGWNVSYFPEGTLRYDGITEEEFKKVGVREKSQNR